ncbi:allophanate hydrolase, subunit 1 [Hyphomonas neptunium ATCC 15444]|uniref:Allophanate hydrolase, subunit 1 n=2 Tax=Hyphomonas TaxID=85 RepID=Q0C0C2_HYPNA|nr:MULTISPECIES: carboxyltransferase domain-containing protein [Hyphomonas]ABI78374.1 allophanate hydrolase, subunit 1 [Hyphomonas neptunium ATCC 15444]KCZ90598.1 allophanate hydrolase subunit 1 [Hyphomonas hirschiana VP5]
MSLCEIFPVGDDAIAVKAADRAARHALAATLRASGRWRDVVPGKGEVTVQFDPIALPPAEARALLTQQAQEDQQTEKTPARCIRLRMRVDAASAPDLERVAAENALTPEAFLTRICASPLLVDMMGFTAGFAYVAGVDGALTASRLPAPRQRVPAGSVGMLTGQLGLYALAGPAGWPIIGAITEPLFDIRRDAPFTLEAGMQIKLAIER